MSRVEQVTRQTLEADMFKHLTAHLDPALKKKVSTSTLREVLSCLAEWAYVERNKWLSGFAESVRAKQAVAAKEAQALKERLKPDGEGSTFLDALDEIR